jgi:8-oxo-dGTP pyrophosphatase MutT (NUDIX family)
MPADERAEIPGHEQDEGSPVHPAATVVVVRDGAHGLETLMLQRSSKLAFAGGMWVWPGGRVDPADRLPASPDDDPAASPDDELAAARRAAVREATEEAGLALDPDALRWISHWTTPHPAPRRFATYFFVAVAPPGDVVVDGGEILDHRWMRPRDAMARRDALEIELVPPTWVTLDLLSRFDTAAAAYEGLGGGEPEVFRARFVLTDDGAVSLYHGDASYRLDEVDLAAPGPRHRLTMGPSGWRYERT